jgi:hypothetical protein
LPYNWQGKNAAIVAPRRDGLAHSVQPAPCRSVVGELELAIRMSRPELGTARKAHSAKDVTSRQRIAVDNAIGTEFSIRLVSLLLWRQK